MLRAVFLLAATGCISLGPMPASTGVSVMPANRTHAEISAATIPASRLSSAATDDDRNGYAVPQLAALFDPDKLLPVRGLFVSVRGFGDDDTGVEPIIGYRRRSGSVAYMLAAYGTKMGYDDSTKDDDGDFVSYDMTRAGAEGGVGYMLADTKWARAHAQATVAATLIAADGSYCIDTEGRAIRCQGSMDNRVDGELTGLYTTASASLALELGPQAGAFHGVRLSAMLAGGHMPRLVGGQQRTGDAFIAFGLGVAVGFGAH